MGVDADADAVYIPPQPPGGVGTDSAALTAFGRLWRSTDIVAPPQLPLYEASLSNPKLLTWATLNLESTPGTPGEVALDRRYQG